MLVIDYVNNMGSRPYEPTNTIHADSMGYALDIETSYIPTDLYIFHSEMEGKTLNQMLAYFKVKLESWMDICPEINGEYEEISSYNANIYTTSPGWYRVAVRIGFTDYDNDGILDSNEMWNFYWRYQTNSLSGLWAEKPLNAPSSLLVNTNGVDPQSLIWNDSTFNYNSDCIYYQIKDVRSPNW